MHRVFLFPLLLLCTSYSLRSWDSLITAVAIITHLCFCRALLRSWESFINTSSLVVPAAWQVEGSHCLKRMGLWSCPDCCCRRSGARGLGCLEPFAGTAICQRHQSLKAAWSLALGHLTILEFHNEPPWRSTTKPPGPFRRAGLDPRVWATARTRTTWGFLTTAPSLCCAVLALRPPLF